jgi:hypothetical protein
MSAFFSLLQTDIHRSTIWIEIKITVQGKTGFATLKK